MQIHLTAFCTVGASYRPGFRLVDQCSRCLVIEQVYQIWGDYFVLNRYNCI